MAYDPIHHNVVLFGGWTSAGALGDTWTWDGTRWMQLHPAQSPQPGAYGGMVFDSAIGKLVFHGGGSVFPYGGTGDGADTWGWDGSTWKHLDSFPLESNSELAFDAARGNLLLEASNGDTWTWDGQHWTGGQAKTSQAGVQQIRQLGGLAYDPQNQVVLFFGGEDPSDYTKEPIKVNETMAWNGSTWTQLHPAVSPAGGKCRMVYDDALGRIVLVEEDGTWTWDGSNWTQLHPTSSPSPMPFTMTNPADASQAFTSIAYDADHRVVVLFGHEGSTAETWTFDGTTWRRVS